MILPLLLGVTVYRWNEKFDATLISKVNGDLTIAHQYLAHILENTGEHVTALEGQTIAGALLATGRTSWRSTTAGEPRGVFCGIGVCFDCIVTVGETRDVRACMRRAQDGDVVTTQDDGDPEVTL